MILAGRAAARDTRRGRELCHSARKTAPTLAGATPTRWRRRPNDRSSPPGAPPARFIRVGLSARRSPAPNTKRISLLGLLCLRLSPGLFNPRPDSRYGESERSEFGSFFILVSEDRRATNLEIEFLPKHRCLDQNLSRCYSREP